MPWLAMVSLMTGCCTYNNIASFPKTEKPVTISIGKGSFSVQQALILGTYYDEPNHIIITGFQNQNGVIGGALLGPLGMLVTDSAGRLYAKEKFGANSDKMAMDLGKLTQDILTQELAAHPVALVSKVVPDSGDVVITPFAVFSVGDAKTARLYVLLEVEMPDPGKDPKWSGRYFARAPGEYLIEGKNGWLAADRFSNGIRLAMQRDLTVLLKEIQRELTASHKVKATGQYPFGNAMGNDFGGDFEIPFVLVDEERDYVVGRLVAPDGVSQAGTHILNRADYQFVDVNFNMPKGIYHVSYRSP